MSKENITIHTISLSDVFNTPDNNLNEIQTLSTSNYFKIKDEPEENLVVQNVEFQSNYPEGLIKKEDEIILDEKNTETISNESKKTKKFVEKLIKAKRTELKRKSPETAQNDIVKRIKIEEFFESKEEETKLIKEQVKFDENLKVKEEKEEQITDVLESNENENSLEIQNSVAEKNNSISTSEVNKRIKSQNFICIFCNEKFTKNFELEAHYSTHKKLEKMKCRYCNKNVMVNPQFILKNLKMREFKCIKCNELAVNNVEISANCDLPIKIVKVQTLKNVEAEEEKKNGKKIISVKCDICGLDVGSNIKLFWHKKHHLELKQFKCPVCRDDFDTREEMIDHCKAIHSKSNKVRCEICKEEFYNVDLTTHMKIHGESVRIEEKAKEVVNIGNLKKEMKQQSENEVKIEKTITQNGYGGSNFFKCSECNIYVKNKEIFEHQLKHSKDKTSILIKNIFKGKK